MVNCSKWFKKASVSWFLVVCFALTMGIFATNGNAAEEQFGY
jgi:hypothetical protein